MNLKNHWPSSHFNGQWRIRIQNVIVFPVDKDDKIIPNPFEYDTTGFRIGVTYPQQFINIDSHRDEYTFNADTAHYCR